MYFIKHKINYCGQENGKIYGNFKKYNSKKKNSECYLSGKADFEKSGIPIFLRLGGSERTDTQIAFIEQARAVKI